MKTVINNLLVHMHFETMESSNARPRKETPFHHLHWKTLTCDQEVALQCSPRKSTTLNFISKHGSSS